MTNQQGAPEALRLADELDAEAGRITQYTNRPGDLLRELAEDELRRMHSEVTTLQAELAAMRAGGEPSFYVRTDEIAKLSSPRLAGLGVMLSKEPGIGRTACYTSPQPAAQDAEDAARYRWLRNKSTVLHNTAWLGGATAFQRDVDFLRRDDALAALDATIDAARKQGATP